jgi:hypothetical protein
MRTFKWHKPIWQRALSGLCLCVSLNCAAASPETVQSLRYGTTLFHFFQQDYYSALTELMVAQELQQLASHEQRAELLRGGMSLSYGMDKNARDIFETLLDTPSELSSLQDRNRAWFYLAKMAWRRGDSANTLSALEKMSFENEGLFSDQADYLRSSIALRDGDEQAALTYADKLTVESPWRYYLYYNLGGNQAAQGNFDAANEYYTRFDQMSFGTEESKEVRDKAFTAHGFSLMASNHFEAAMRQFTRVRLNSPMADRALLGYGWAASEMGNFGLALSSWQTLTGRELGSPSAREGLLAIPYAYEELGNAGFALENYRRAANAYVVQLSSVKAAIADFRDGSLAETLGMSAGKPGVGADPHGWVFGDDILPTGSHGRILAELLTRHGFQLALRGLQDLYRMAWHLEDASERLQNLAQVDADQQASWASVTHGGRGDALQQRHAKLQQRIAALDNKILKAQSSADGERLLADTAQTNLWKKLDHSTDISSLLSAQGSSADQAARLSLMRGLMLWQDSEQFVARRWTVQRELNELQTLAAKSEALLAKVDDAVARHGELEFAHRIAAMDERIKPHRQRVDRAIVQSETQIRQLAIAQLEQHENELSRALGQSRLAIARLYDNSSAEASP